MSKDKAQRDRLIAQNTGLVHACAGRFRGKGVEYEDLFQAGCVGLCKAADKFDESLGYAFSTYAVPTILGEIRRVFRDGGAVKVGRALKEQAAHLYRMRERLAQTLGRDPLLSELAELAGMEPEQTAFVLNAAMPVVSLTAPAQEETATRQTDVPVPSPDREIEERVALHSALNALPPQERLLIELRFYKGWTQSRTAESLGISQVQVSRKEKAILQKMRAMVG